MPDGDATKSALREEGLVRLKSYADSNRSVSAKHSGYFTARNYRRVLKWA
jgi:hypothetical protein